MQLSQKAIFLVPFVTKRGRHLFFLESHAKCIFTQSERCKINSTHWSRMKPFRSESPKIQLHQMGFLSFPCLNMDLFALLNVIYILWNLSFSAFFISNMIHKMSSALKKYSFMQKTPRNYFSYCTLVWIKKRHSSCQISSVFKSCFFSAHGLSAFIFSCSFGWTFTTLFKLCILKVCFDF